jgi:nitrogen fixation NifU-like protein
MAPGSGLEDVYQDLILDHSRRPRNFGAPAGATHSARGDNPFCGDRVTVFLVRSADRIADVGFEGAGCAISMASASMMTTRMKGLTAEQAADLCRQFEDLLGDAALQDHELGDLSAFAAVSRFPVRIKCARLPWQTLLAALSGASDTVSTE